MNGTENAINQVYEKNGLLCVQYIDETSFYYIIKVGNYIEKYRKYYNNNRWWDSFVDRVNEDALTNCKTQQEMLKLYGLLPAEGLEGFIEQATGTDGINNDNLWENMKPIVPGLIIATLFALGIVVVERLVNRSSKGKA